MWYNNDVGIIKGERVTDITVPDKELAFDVLAKKWEPLLNKFASWKFGMEYEDLYQEMLLLLYKAQNSFDPSRHTSFITYLYRAALNRVRHLKHVTTELQRVIPQHALVPLCDGTGCAHFDPNGTYHPSIVDDVSGIDLLVGASAPAKKVASLFAKGVSVNNLTIHGLTKQQADTGLRELKQLLTS